MSEDKNVNPETGENNKTKEGKNLKERFAAAKKASVTKKIKRAEARIAKLQKKLESVEKEKTPIDKKKLLIGAGIVCAALGTLGGAVIMRNGKTICQDSPCEEVPSCGQPTEETNVPASETET